MKKILFFVVLIASLGCNASAISDTPIDYSVSVQAYNGDNVLENIQSKIDQAFTQSVISGSSKELDAISAQLSALFKEQPINLVQYWRAYSEYYLAVFYSNKQDEKNSEKHIDEGIDYLKNMKNKNSEDYALLAMMQSFSIQFVSGMKAGIISRKVQKNANKALSLDEQNLRAYFVLGSNDFYTPESFGGGKKAEQYLKDALSKPDQKVKNSYLPSWGREASYELLIKHYIKKENWKEAVSWFSKANKDFPNSYLLNALAPQLIGK